MDNETRVATIAKVHEAGAVVTVSLGGSNDQRWETDDAKALATAVYNNFNNTNNENNSLIFYFRFRISQTKMIWMELILILNTLEDLGQSIIMIMLP